jgi:hypothetical protein
MSKTDGCDPWDPRCSTLPKPELFTAIIPDSECVTFATYQEAIDYLEDMNFHSSNLPIGVIHKHHTQIVYFHKDEEESK